MSRIAKSWWRNPGYKASNGEGEDGNGVDKCVRRVWKYGQGLGEEVWARQRLGAGAAALRMYARTMRSTSPDLHRQRHSLSVH